MDNLQGKIAGNVFVELVIYSLKIRMNIRDLKFEGTDYAVVKIKTLTNFHFYIVVLLDFLKDTFIFNIYNLKLNKDF